MALINLTDVLNTEDTITIEDIVNAMRLSAEDMHINVKATEDIAAGLPTMFVGYNSGLDEIEIAIADNTVNVAIGITRVAIANGESGYIVSSGVLDGIDTSGYTEGEILYVNGGVLSNVEPTVGFSQPIAYVLKPSATVGSLMVTVDYPKQDAADVRFDATKSVEDELALKAPLASPALTGSPTTPTPATADETTLIASTLYVINKINDEAGTSLAQLVGGLVPAAQLPSYVDDVREYADYATMVANGDGLAQDVGVIYVTLDDNIIYRWSGSVYIEISSDTQAVWGNISGTLSNQTDLQDALDLKVNTTTLNAWAGSTNITILGTIATGVWQGTAIADTYISSAATWHAKYDSSDLGVTVQGYDSDTVKYDVAGTFTNPQRMEVNTGQTNAIAFNSDNNFEVTATAANITVTNQTVGQSGNIVINTAENITGWGTEFDWGSLFAPTDLLGTETFAYYISGASGIASIKIGRL